MLFYELVEAVGVAGLEESEYPAFLLSFLDEVFRNVCRCEIVEHEITVKLLRICEYSRSYIICKFSLFPADNTVNRAVGEELLCLGYHCFLHRKSSNLRLGPRAFTSAVNCSIVAANLAPSAAETHSRRVRFLSMPRKSSIL